MEYIKKFVIIEGEIFEKELTQIASKRWQCKPCGNYYSGRQVFTDESAAIEKAITLINLDAIEYRKTIRESEIDLSTCEARISRMKKRLSEIEQHADSQICLQENEL